MLTLQHWHAHACRWYEADTVAAVPASEVPYVDRFPVGTWVTVAEDYKAVGNAAEGPLRPGMYGMVVQTNESAEPSIKVRTPHCLCKLMPEAPTCPTYAQLCLPPHTCMGLGYRRRALQKSVSYVCSSGSTVASTELQYLVHTDPAVLAVT